MFEMKRYVNLVKLIIWISTILMIVSISTSCMSGPLRDKWKQKQAFKNQDNADISDAACDTNIPPIMNGYGSNGSYDMDIQNLSNPMWRGKAISVFSPKGASGKHPVIFFSHAFGATDWQKVYSPLMKHIVSLGYMVVFSPYPTVMASFDKRYDTLWSGFELSVAKFGHKMDLTRVGFVGHSFGGGATPAMAYKGLVGKKWGSKGAFLYIMAPWYSFQITSEKMEKYPDHVVLIMQIYDKDDVNDHRMAIDVFKSIKLPASQKHFQFIRSESFNGCELVADHATPARNPSLRLKQYAVFKPFDAVSDYVFDGDSGGNQYLLNIAKMDKINSYRPLSNEKDPRPKFPESIYKFSWNDRNNERRGLEKW
ncbi:MAG: hypothetical protein KKE44_09690 [Proteobacteria bacterium]|nr:hypothetical protein [Pseudomonadota bacterium]MBU1582995.1 hypothetical protein [Pseudomonadota bacterium]MBU2453551.1 hypothetical protein [Pseudomonadota bacterium]MBU2631454.1 hypothetical protein [Pseudomonadota bacterium]